jgi:hypothetical protein
MKAVFKSTERLGKKLSSIFLGYLLVVPFAAIAQMDTFVSPAIVPVPPSTSAPAVNATNFINAGVWNIETEPLPYQTANTLNYTNTGQMNGSVGWEFDHGPLSGGSRGWSANFFNDNFNPNNGNGTISASDLSFRSINNSILTASYLLISATNIVNKGLLEAGANGEIILNGSEVNLSRSFLEITPIVGVGSSDSKTNFTPDVAIYDEFWQGANSNKLTVTGSPWNGTSLGVATFQNVNLPCGDFATEEIGQTNAPQTVDSYATNIGPHMLQTTNSALQPNPPITIYSNIVHQGIFVFVNSSNIVAKTHFGLMLSPTNIFLPMAVQLATVSTNITTETLQTNFLYVIDNMAAVGTNGGLVTNMFVFPSAPCTSPTERPASVIISRTDNGTFASGFPGMGRPSSTFFYEPFTTAVPLPELSEGFSNFVATGKADAYSALIDNLAAEPAPGFSITNAPGRINIFARDLDLSRTRISAASEILIQATNLIGSTGAVMDSQNLSYNLGSTNGSLNIMNLAVQNVQRLHGTISEWSGLWTNYMVNVYQNFITNSAATNGGPIIESDITNVTEVDLAVMVVDAGGPNGLMTTIPVIVQDLNLHSTNMTITDPMQVSQNLLFDGQSLTIQGNLTLVNAIQDWNSAIAPTLRFFTNNGVLQIPNSAHFGDDRAVNYAAFVNHGSISSGSQTINSDYLEINGGEDEVSAANFTASCRTGLVVNAEIFTTGDIQFFANNLQIDPSILSASGAIDFTATNSLSDTGISGNTFACQNGFNLFIKPVTGDLLGTTITDTALEENEVDHIWAGHDFGTNAAGYLNNVAIGTLVLNQDSSVFEPLFHFTGANVANGLYVSNLDLSTLTDYANELEIDPNLVIYFISAKLNTNVVITPFSSAAAFLDGQFGGHLRWVQNTGASSTTGTTTLSSSMISGGRFQFNVTGASGSQTNIVQASTNLINWVPIYTNMGSMTFTDAAANTYPHRFYRVMTSP